MMNLSLASRSSPKLGVLSYAHVLMWSCLLITSHIHCLSGVSIPKGILELLQW